MKIEMHAESKTYPIYLERGILKKAKEYIGRSGKVFLISDDGVPEQWRNLLQKQYPSASMYVFKNGEASKNFDTLQDILKSLHWVAVSLVIWLDLLPQSICVVFHISIFQQLLYLKSTLRLVERPQLISMV